PWSHVVTARDPVRTRRPATGALPRGHRPPREQARPVLAAGARTAALPGDRQPLPSRLRRRRRAARRPRPRRTRRRSRDRRPDHDRLRPRGRAVDRGAAGLRALPSLPPRRCRRAPQRGRAPRPRPRPRGPHADRPRRGDRRGLRAAARSRDGGVGETGLDWFRTSRRDEQARAAQIDSFRAHIALAKELDLPLQIHDRDAHRDVLEVLEADGAPERTVLHCFSGDAEFARACVDRGWYLSFAGTVTFKNAADLRAALAEVGLGQVMVETDAPFLT